ncbi:hypothetical protein ACFV9D_01120 [Streptomyces sp. NPDC059875]|uniref:hypothetical protein n=1 Tax=unclassified Streptomyces TaxID=2593676 RepID=UPI003651A6C8
MPDARVEWQVVDRNSRADPAAWRPATGVDDWSLSRTTSAYGEGHKTLVARLVERDAETARSTARARFRQGDRGPACRRPSSPAEASLRQGSVQASRRARPIHVEWDAGVDRHVT